jgi:hypothetical protein
MITGALSLGQIGRGVKLTTHFQLLPRSRKRGSMHPLPHTPSRRSALLVNHRDNFTFLTFTIFHQGTPYTLQMFRWNLLLPYSGKQAWAWRWWQKFFPNFKKRLSGYKAYNTQKFVLLVVTHVIPSESRNILALKSSATRFLTFVPCWCEVTAELAWRFHLRVAYDLVHVPNSRTAQAVLSASNPGGPPYSRPVQVTGKRA